MVIPAPIYSREHYMAKIRPYMGKSLIKVFTGQRRVGKSYLMYQLMDEIRAQEGGANIIYINKEDMQFDAIKEARDLHDYVTKHLLQKQRNYIFIDEIQDIDEFEKALRSLLLDSTNDIYITGSNGNLLSGELATFLSGRYIEFTIYSLSYPEFLQFHHLSDNDSNLGLYIRYGGLPYLINLSLTDVAYEYISSVYSTIVFRDVVSRYSLRNTKFLEQLILFLADNTGSLFSAKRISDFLKSQRVNIAPNQVQQYLSYLSEAFLIHDVKRYDMIGRRIFEIGGKYYFENTGIRNAVIGFRIEDQGKLLENVVYNHLLYLGYNVMVGSWDAQEIDFVCDRGGEKLYVQVALYLRSENTLEREFGNLLKIEDNYPKIVVSYDKFEGNSYKGIEHQSVRAFLMRTS